MSMSGRADEHRWPRWASETHQRSLGQLWGVVGDEQQRSRMSIRARIKNENVPKKRQELSSLTVYGKQNHNRDAQYQLLPMKST